MSSGYYTCYKRGLNYVPWTYSTGNLNPGVVSVVSRIPYSIGYSVLGDAAALGLSIASLINKGGAVVAASADSISYAVMERGTCVVCSSTWTIFIITCMGIDFYCDCCCY